MDRPNPNPLNNLPFSNPSTHPCNLSPHPNSDLWAFPKDRVQLTDN